MDLKLDYVFILVKPEARVADRFLGHGFQAGPNLLVDGQANRF